MLPLASGVVEFVVAPFVAEPPPSPAGALRDEGAEALGARSQLQGRGEVLRHGVVVFDLQLPVDRAGWGLANEPA